MPFKSKKQERYLQINEPEIYQDWVEKYGRFSAESLCIVCNDKPVDKSHPNSMGVTCNTPRCVHYLYSAESFGAEAIPIRHSRRLNGYYGIKGYDDASEDGFTYRIYRSPGTNDWFRAMVYDDNSLRDNFTKPTSRRLNPSGEMVISNDPASLLIGAFPKLEDAKRALVFRMIQDGNYDQMLTDGNLKWLLKDYYAESFGAEGDYEPSFDSLEERIEWMEFAVNDKFLHQYEDDYSNVVLDIEEWNENNGNNSKLSNLVKQYKNKTGWMDAESFAATTGKRMYCPACQTNRTWMTGYKKREMDYTKGERPQDFRFYVCNTCEYAYDPKTSLEIKNWKIKYYGAESFNAEGWHTTRIQNLIDNLYNDREIALNKLLKIKNVKLQKLLSSNKLLKDRVGGLSLAQWAEVQAQLKYTPSGRIRTFGAESFGAEEWWEEYRDELEAVDKSSLDDFEIIIWNDDIVKKHGKAKMMQLIINTIEHSTKLSPQLAKIARKQEEDMGEWGEGMGYDPDAKIGSPYYAESFGAEECVSCDTPDGYWRGLPLCSSSGEELCISCCSCNMCRSKWNILEVGEQKAESFNSYKVAPDLSSYTKAELVSSIAGPQGTAAYDEVVYDPLAQSRLSAESIDSFSPARLIVLGASIGVALGLYNTRRD